MNIQSHTLSFVETSCTNLIGKHLVKFIIIQLDGSLWNKSRENSFILKASMSQIILILPLMFSNCFNVNVPLTLTTEITDLKPLFS